MTWCTDDILNDAILQDKNKCTESCTAEEEGELGARGLGNDVMEAGDVSEEEEDHYSDEDVVVDRPRGQSNNPCGRHDTSTRVGLCSADEILRALSFEHPSGTKSTTPCEGLGLPADAVTDSNAIRRMLNPIEALRLEVYGNTCSARFPQRLLDMLWKKHAEHVSDLRTGDEDKHTPISSMPWTIGSRRVCHACWAAAAGLLTHPSLTRRKQSFAQAITAYNSNSRVILTARTFKQGGRGSRKRDAAMAWIEQFVSEEEGNAQQKTGDEHQHLQGVTQANLWEKYRHWHDDPENSRGGRLVDTCSESTFNRGLRDMRETSKLPTVFAKVGVTTT